MMFTLIQLFNLRLFVFLWLDHCKSLLNFQIAEEMYWRRRRCPHMSPTELQLNVYGFLTERDSNRQCYEQTAPSQTDTCFQMISPPVWYRINAQIWGTGVAHLPQTPQRNWEEFCLDFLQIHTRTLVYRATCTPRLSAWTSHQYPRP